jgi:hypothetical protein
METQHYWQEVKRRVCMKCIDGDGYGNCLIDPSIDCPLEVYFPKVIDTVFRVQSDRIDEYVEELRTAVCAECKYRTATGTCILRPNAECALDRYFPLIVQAVEEMNQPVWKTYPTSPPASEVP